MSGAVVGSEEAFACEADRRDRRGAGPLVVRHVSGLSRSLLNRAVYDRQSDWVLSVDAGPAVDRHARPRLRGPNGRLSPCGPRAAKSSSASGPRFYQKHRGLAFFEPWTYRPWPSSVAGWISWFAFFDAVTEKDIVETADVFSEALGPFGYEYFQIDDGYQRGPGRPGELARTPTPNSPAGSNSWPTIIKSKGLTPGLWTAASCLDQAFVDAHPQWFVRDAGGQAGQGQLDRLPPSTPRTRRPWTPSSGRSTRG